MKNKLVDIISEALVANAFEAAFNVPGYGGSEVINKLKSSGKIKTFINLNEEAAFSISYGVSSNGKRSALLIKSQGFAKATNAITSSLSTETNAANLIFVFDDTAGKSSDNILPTTSLVKGTEIPFVRIGKDAYKQILGAIKLSETLKLPVALIVDCKKLNLESDFKISRVTNKASKKRISYLTRVACPVLTLNQREYLKNKLIGKRSQIKDPKIKDLREILPPTIKSEFSKYEKFFDVFKQIRPDFVSGDAGTSALFAFEPYCCVDTCTYMGGGPGMAIGAYIAGISSSLCITGDFSFLSAGVLGFNEALIHNIPLKLVIFDNGKAHATGGQEIPPVLMNKFKTANKDSITCLNLGTASIAHIQTEVSKLLSADTLSILIVEVH